MSSCEYCALIVEGDGHDKYIVITYKPDGSVKQEWQADGGAESVMKALHRAGWEYAFQDVEGPQAQVFFKRPLSAR
jgi:hypothetical protein